jgi:hypothetical protein
VLSFPACFVYYNIFPRISINTLPLRRPFSIRKRRNRLCFWHPT